MREQAGGTSEHMRADSIDDDGGAFRATVEALQLQAASELATARALIGVSAGVSLVAALAMILCFVLFQESRRCGRRVLLCLHVADAGAACAWLLTLAHPERDEEDLEPGSRANGPHDSPISSLLCHAQAYLLLFFVLASCLWTACFAFHLFQLLGRHKTAPERYESRYHVVAWGIPLFAVFHIALQQLLGYDLVGESGLPWCWMRTWSDSEWAPTGVLVQLGVFYGPLLAIVLHNVSTYLTLLNKLQTDDISSAMEAQICSRMVAYTCALVFALVWGFVALLYQVCALSDEVRWD